MDIFRKITSWFNTKHQSTSADVEYQPINENILPQVKLQPMNFGDENLLKSCEIKVKCIEFICQVLNGKYFVIIHPKNFDEDQDNESLCYDKDNDTSDFRWLSICSFFTK